MTELVNAEPETVSEKDTAQPEAKTAPAEVKVVSEEEQRAREEAALDDKLRKVFRAAKKDRDAENGRYTSKAAKQAPNAEDVASQKAPPTAEKQNSAEKAEVKDQTPNRGAEPDAATAEKPADKPTIEPPKSWSADKKAVWDSLSPEAREYVSQREHESRKAISQMGETVKRMEPIGHLLEQHKDTFASKGLSYEAGVDQLLRAQAALDRDPANAVKQIAQAYGVDLYQLAGGEPQQVDPQVAQLQAQVSQLTRALTSMQSDAQTRARAEADAKLGTIEATIDKFAADKPDFEELATDIEMLLGPLRKLNPNAPYEQIIAEAYERAKWSNPKSRQRMIEDKAKKEEAARVEAAKKAAEDAKVANLINVTGTAASDGHADLDDMLRAIVRRNRAA